MALIKDAKGRKKGSGYQRLFDNDMLGELITRVHSTVISSGTELEKTIKSKVELIEDLDEFLKAQIMQEGVKVANKKQIKDCHKLEFIGSEPDFLIFKRRKGKQACHLVELKDGDAFDTKKASAEHTSMHSFISKNAQRIPYTVQAHFCCFNQDSKQAIHKGFKEKISFDEAMTGREFCNLLEINYDEIVAERKLHGEENRKYFLTELAKIPFVRKFFKDYLDK